MNQSSILFVLGSRGEWGYIKPIINKSKEYGFNPLIFACNMVVLESFGGLISEIENEGFKVVGKSLSALNGDSHQSMAKSMNLLGLGFADTLANVNPTWVVCAGDRAEQLIAAMTSSYMYIPVAHIQAGERSGNIDDSARHAIARMAHIHFASNQDAYDRLIRSGEQSWRVHLTGAPQLDDLFEYKTYNSQSTLEKYHLISKKYIISVIHPVTEELASATAVIENTMSALHSFNIQVVWILPNNDAGGDQIKKYILKNKRSTDLAFSNLDRIEFALILKESNLIIGNSSAGLLEAPNFELPAINIGRRQINRIRGKNVIDCANNLDEIQNAINLALSRNFLNSVKGMLNPYGNGKSSKQILEILRSTKITQELLRKELTY